MSVTPVFTRTDVSGVLGLTGQQAYQIWGASKFSERASLNKKGGVWPRKTPTHLHTHVHANQQKPKQKEKGWLKVREIALLDLVLSQTEHRPLLDQTRRVKTVLLGGETQASEKTARQQRHSVQAHTLPVQTPSLQTPSLHSSFQLQWFILKDLEMLSLGIPDGSCKRPDTIIILVYIINAVWNFSTIELKKKNPKIFQRGIKIPVK